MKILRKIAHVTLVALGMPAIFAALTLIISIISPTDDGSRISVIMLNAGGAGFGYLLLWVALLAVSETFIFKKPWRDYHWGE